MIRAPHHAPASALSGQTANAIRLLSEDAAARGQALTAGAALRELAAYHQTLQGSAASAAHAPLLADLERIRRDGRKTMGSPDMAAAYDQQIAAAHADATMRIDAHAARQALVERVAAQQTALRQAQEDAATQWHAPADFIAGLDRVAGLAAEGAASERESERLVRKAQAATVALALTKALDAGEPAIAQAMLSTWATMLPLAVIEQTRARLLHAEQIAHVRATLARLASGDTDASDTTAGSAVGPIAMGIVVAVDGASTDFAVTVRHADGSEARYDGIGLIAVQVGDMVVPGHVLGTASPRLAIMIDGTQVSPDQALAPPDTPRHWDLATLLDRVEAYAGFSAEQRELARCLARQRTIGDQGTLDRGSIEAGRAVIAALAAGPALAADLPPALLAQLLPDALSSIDRALRQAALAPRLPVRDNGAALRIELLARLAPRAFHAINLATLIGRVHPANLTELTTRQGQATPDTSGGTMREAILDALARHELATSAPLSDTLLPAIADRMATIARLGGVAPDDRSTLDKMAAAAIQSCSSSLHDDASTELL